MVSPIAMLETSVVATPTPPFDVTTVETAPGTGVVAGVLLVRSGDGEKPVPNVILALGDLIPDDSGQERVVGFDRANSLSTTTEDDGRFVLTDIPPGRYGLVLDTVMSSYLLFEPGGTEALLITVEPGRPVDMGVLLYDMLPIPDLE